MYQKPTAKGRPLGYVIHEPRIAFLAPITNLLIGIAPFFGGVLVAFLVTKEIVPELLYLSVFEVTLKQLQDRHKKWPSWCYNINSTKRSGLLL